MVINIQFQAASDLLWELFRELPTEKRALFSARINNVSSQLFHPNLDGAIVFSVGLDSTLHRDDGKSQGRVDAASR